MSIIVVIPARYNSKRFPAKALFSIKSKALVHHVYDNIISCSTIDKCIIATDDISIFDYCQFHNLQVQMTSVSHSNGTERVAEVAKGFEEDDIIINVQGDEPLVMCEQIDSLIALLENDPQCQIASLARRVAYNSEIENSNIVKLVVDKNDNALFFSRASIPYCRDKDALQQGDSFLQHIGMYAFRASIIQELIALPESYLERLERLEQLRWLENGFQIKIGYTDKKLIGIDSMDDVDELLQYWDSLG